MGDDAPTHNASVPSSHDVVDVLEFLRVPTPASARHEPKNDVVLESLGETASKPRGVETLTARKDFEFAGDLESVPEARARVMEFVHDHCTNEEDEIDILVSLQEGLANAALHGCGNDPKKRYRCSVLADGSDITLTISDPGPGFDVAAADPDNYESTTLDHGRGICLIRSLMSEVGFPQGGTEIRLRKRMGAR